MITVALADDERGGNARHRIGLGRPENRRQTRQRYGRGVALTEGRSPLTPAQSRYTLEGGAPARPFALFTRFREGGVLSAFRRGAGQPVTDRGGQAFVTGGKLGVEMRPVFRIQGAQPGEQITGDLGQISVLAQPVHLR